MKVRWAIEHGLDSDPEGTVYMALVNDAGDNVPFGSKGLGYRSEAEARADAEQAASTENATITWKPAPADWQPDTYLVSSYYTDRGWDQ
jgi:hypothetical protein